MVYVSKYLVDLVLKDSQLAVRPVSAARRLKPWPLNPGGGSKERARRTSPFGLDNKRPKYPNMQCLWFLC